MYTGMEGGGERWRRECGERGGGERVGREGGERWRGEKRGKLGVTTANKTTNFQVRQL